MDLAALSATGVMKRVGLTKRDLWPTQKWETMASFYSSWIQSHGTKSQRNKETQLKFCSFIPQN